VRGPLDARRFPHRDRRPGYPGGNSVIGPGYP
jgi:hypothetical protein